MMPPLPRGICSLCGADVALRTGGEVREHRDLRDKSSICSGSGAPPAGAKASSLTIDEALRQDLIHVSDDELELLRLAVVNLLEVVSRDKAAGLANVQQVSALDERLELIAAGRSERAVKS